jgi:hypothetical protein
MLGVVFSIDLQSQPSEPNHYLHLLLYLRPQSLYHRQLRDGKTSPLPTVLSKDIPWDNFSQDPDSSL